MDFSIWTGPSWSSNNSKEPLDWHRKITSEFRQICSGICNVQQKLEVAAEYASSHAEVEQERYKKYQNLRSADKHFEVGQQVLVLIPDTTASKLFSKWSPATVVAVRSPYSYEVNLDGNVRHYHANHLRKYHVRIESVLYDSSV